MEICDAQRWAEGQFGGSELGHRARSKRAVVLAADLMRAPAASLPKACGSSAKRAYEFLSNEEVTHARLLSGPVEQTIRACEKEATVLVVQDTTAPTFGGRNRRDGLGPVNSEMRVQGMLVHTCLALSEQGRVLGVLEQEVWTRPTAKHSRFETQAERRKRPRESERWARCARAVHQRFAASGARPRCIHVADRESDIFDLFEQLHALGESFVLRAMQNRRTDEGELSFELVEKSPVVAHKDVDVPARAGRPSRRAHLELRAQRVQVRPPKNRGEGGEPVWMHVVIASEVDAPSTKEALRWNLLTREPIDSEAAVLRVVELYSRRWVIEDFHMGLKTGCALEERQLESFQALSAFLAIASAIAVHVLQLRDAARDTTDRPATDVLTPLQLKLLRHEVPKLPLDCSANRALRAIATLGGFFDTSAKAKPGWRTLFGGMQRLLEREAGYLQALEEFRAAGLTPEMLAAAGFRE